MSDLLQALYRGNRERADDLLAAEPTLDVFEAAAVGRSDRLRELLDEDPSRANAFGDDGFHPLGLHQDGGGGRNRNALDTTGESQDL